MTNSEIKSFFTDKVNQLSQSIKEAIKEKGEIANSAKSIDVAKDNHKSFNDGTADRSDNINMSNWEVLFKFLQAVGLLMLFGSWIYQNKIQADYREKISRLEQYRSMTQNSTVQYMINKAHHIERRENFRKDSSDRNKELLLEAARFRGGLYTSLVRNNIMFQGSALDRKLKGDMIALIMQDIYDPGLPPKYFDPYKALFYDTVARNRGYKDTAVRRIVMDDEKEFMKYCGFVNEKKVTEPNWERIDWWLDSGRTKTFQIEQSLTGEVNDIAADWVEKEGEAEDNFFWFYVGGSALLIPSYVRSSGLTKRNILSMFSKVFRYLRANFLKKPHASKN